MRGAFLVFFGSLSVLGLSGQYLLAHPVPKQNHDRTIEVQLTPDAVVVKYQLEIDEYRAVQDLSKEELARINSPRDLARVFLESSAPVLRNNLIARLDGVELSFQGSGEIDPAVTDHLRCNFTFTASWKPSPERAHLFTFREANYDGEDFDRIQLALTAGPGVILQQITAPDAVLWEGPPLERKPGHLERLRTLSATFVTNQSGRAGSVSDRRDAPVTDAPGSPESGEQRPHKLFHLLLDTRYGVAMLLLLAAGFGAAHALTPGHGKTLVAAYLVGEHGTVWHALLLGLMTTLTHTGAVILLAIVFMISPRAAQWLYQVQGLAGGLLITLLGLWLLIQRLFGRPDHFHIGGHSHHHHHPTHDHAPAHVHEPAPVPSDSSSARWWHLLVLGMRGGMVPCWDAIWLLCLAISAGRLGLALPLLLAFSAGLAGVLVALGVSVVWTRNWALARWGSDERMRKIAAVLPLLSAAVITGLGLWLCYDATR